jgi:hypothetical protein
MGNKCRKEKVIAFVNNGWKTMAQDGYCRDPGAKLE